MASARTLGRGRLYSIRCGGAVCDHGGDGGAGAWLRGSYRGRRRAVRRRRAYLSGSVRSRLPRRPRAFVRASRQRGVPRPHRRPRALPPTPPARCAADLISLPRVDPDVRAGARDDLRRRPSDDARSEIGGGRGSACVRGGADSPRNDLDHAAEVLYCSTAPSRRRYVALVLAVCLTLHADHERSASTFARSWRWLNASDLHAAIRGPLQPSGAASRRRQRRLSSCFFGIEDPGQAEAFRCRPDDTARACRAPIVGSPARCPGSGTVYEVDYARAGCYADWLSRAEATGRGACSRPRGRVLGDERGRRCGERRFFSAWSTTRSHRPGLCTSIFAMVGRRLCATPRQYATPSARPSRLDGSAHGRSRASRCNAAVLAPTA